MENQLEKIPQSQEQLLDAVQAGQTVQRTQAGFTTAVQVQKPRDIEIVMERCEKEATLAGDSFYYAWTVKGEKGSGLVEGPSVDLAHAAVRNWGNCGVMVDVKETSDTYIFTATFIDLETGFNLQRAFRQRKTQKMGKRYDDARSEDIVFQIGQSKAIRNVIVNALPSWLIDGMMERAKENIVARIEKKGIAKAKEDTVAFFQKYNISIERVEQKMKKKASAWTVEDLALLYGAIKSLTTGQESPDELFPPISTPVVYNAPNELIIEIRELFTLLAVPSVDQAMQLGACKIPDDFVLLRNTLLQDYQRKNAEIEKKPELAPENPAPSAEELFGKDKKEEKKKKGQ